MSSCTTLLLSFEFHGDRGALVPLAHKHVDISKGRSREADDFLSALAAGDCVGVGRKGDVVSWGCVGNYVSEHDFIGALMLFFVDCFNSGLISEYNQVIVLFQREHGAQIEAYEIGMKEPGPLGRPITRDALRVEGARIRFPLWNAIDRFGPGDLDRLPALDLDDQDDE